MESKEKQNKDIEQLNDITKLAAELQEKISRYNARQKSFCALYGMDNIVAQIWVASRNIRDSIEDNN